MIGILHEWVNNGRPCHTELMPETERLADDFGERFQCSTACYHFWNGAARGGHGRGPLTPAVISTFVVRDRGHPIQTSSSVHCP